MEISAGWLGIKKVKFHPGCELRFWGLPTCPSVIIAEFPEHRNLILPAIYQTDKLVALLFRELRLSTHVPTGAMPTLGPALLAQNTVFSGNPESVSLKK
jgi:hypothetical protein